MNVLDSMAGRQRVVDFLTQNEANIQRVYSDHLGIPTIGISYALAINIGSSGNPVWDLRGIDQVNNDFRTAGILGQNDNIVILGSDEHLNIF